MLKLNKKNDCNLAIPNKMLIYPKVYGVDPIMKQMRTRFGRRTMRQHQVWIFYLGWQFGHRLNSVIDAFTESGLRKHMSDQSTRMSFLSTDLPIEEHHLARLPVTTRFVLQDLRQRNRQKNWDGILRRTFSFNFIFDYNVKAWLGKARPSSWRQPHHVISNALQHW